MLGSVASAGRFRAAELVCETDKKTSLRSPSALSDFLDAELWTETPRTGARQLIPYERNQHLKCLLSLVLTLNSAVQVHLIKLIT